MHTQDLQTPETRIQAMVESQKTFFHTGRTKDVTFRKQQLELLRTAIHTHEADILHALHQDMKKPAVEAYITEVGFTYEEIRFTLKHLHRWTRPTRVPTPMLHFWSRSFTMPEPLGVTLIIGPWNYPFQLVIAPLVGAIAAGNCAIVKPSNMSPHTSHVLAEMIKNHFEPRYITVLEGGRETTQAILDHPLDHIFFTGSPEVGKTIMEAAAKHLTPVTLELGGKSPCIVDAKTPLSITARRIAWGKFLNAGQTCIAPDYLLVHHSIAEPLVAGITQSLHTLFGKNPVESPDYARIVNDKHFERLKGYLTDGEIVHGGQSNREERYISPTLLGEVSSGAKVMQDEIFGPILPIIPYRDLDEAIAFVTQRPKPLALYFFSQDSANQKRILNETTSGGVTLNDTLIHISNPHLPFGGIGHSGMGAYHGKKSFDTLSHHKGVLRKTLWFDLRFRYPPYRKKMSLMKRLMS